MTTYEYFNLFKWLRNGSSRDADVNGAVTPVEFIYEVPAGDTLEWERIIIFIEDTGSFDSGLYGNGIALTNGIKVEVHDSEGNVILDLVDGETVHTNGEWQALCHDFLPTAIGQGNEVASVRWTVAKSGAPVVVKSGCKVVVTIQDNLAGLEKHWFQIQGVLT